MYSLREEIVLKRKYCSGWLAGLEKLKELTFLEN